MALDFSNIKEFSINGTDIKSIDINNVRVWEKTSPEPIDYSIPFWIDNPGTARNIFLKKSGSSAPNLTLYYSYDNSTWTKWTASTTSSQSLSIRANSRMYLRCYNTTKTWATSSYYNNLSINSGMSIGGNILSLLYGQNFNGQTEFPTGTEQYQFYNAFSGSSLSDASELLLPPTTLRGDCYHSMFARCTNLRTTPKLPATTLANYCYTAMFSGCSSITTAPKLPVTTLTRQCYYGMFQNCTSLVQAPVLPATTLETQSYMFMFSGCTSLQYIKCLARNLGQGGTTQWVANVPSGGTFIKNASMSGWTTGVDGIPSGWTVQNA